MARKIRQENNAGVENDSISRGTVFKETGSTNYGLIDKRWGEIMDKILKMRSEDFLKIDCYEKWIDAFDEYESIEKEIFAFSNDERFPEGVRETKAETLYYALRQYYDNFYRHFMKWGLKHFKVAEDEARKASVIAGEIEDKAEKAQALNLTVFSIFITVITFLLSNVFVIGNDPNLDLKKVVIINLTLLFVSSLLFLFVGFFLGLAGFSGKNKKGWFLLISPFLALAALFFVGFCWR